MSAATASINTPQRPGNNLALIVAAGAAVFAGTLGARDAAGKLVPAADTAGLRAVGRVEIDGVAGDTVNVEKGTFLFANNATNALTAASVGKLCFVVDDSTVASTSTNKIVAGRVIEVTDDGVWVDTTDIPVSALPAATGTAATDIAAILDALA